MGRPSQRSRLTSSAPSSSSSADLRALEAQRGGALAQLGREVFGGDVEPDAEHRPALLRAPLDQDAGDLAPPDPDVVGPLDRGGQRQRLADRHRGGERQPLAQLAQDDGHQDGGARRRGPDPSLAAAARGLLVGGDQRAVRRAERGELARALVGRVGAAQVDPRPADHRGAQADLGIRLHAERAGGVAAVDRHGERAVGVLVYEQLSGPHVGEGLGVGGQVALARRLDLNRRAELDVRAGHVVVVDVEADVAEAVHHQRVGHQRAVLGPRLRAERPR